MRRWSGFLFLILYIPNWYFIPRAFPLPMPCFRTKCDSVTYRALWLRSGWFLLLWFFWFTFIPHPLIKNLNSRFRNKNKLNYSSKLIIRNYYLNILKTRIISITITKIPNFKYLAIFNVIANYCLLGYYSHRFKLFPTIWGK